MQSKSWLCASVLACGVLIATGAAAERPFDPALAAMGEEKFATYCQSCHGSGGRGDGPVALALKTPPPDLTQIAARRRGGFPDAEIARIIDGRSELTAHGTREMPVWGARWSASIPEAGIADEFARGAIATLLEYLKSIQRSG